jgi:hypothetical protein
MGKVERNLMLRVCLPSTAAADNVVHSPQGDQTVIEYVPIPVKVLVKSIEQTWKRTMNP